MFLHIGSETDVPVEQIICVLDISAMDAKPTRGFIQKQKDENRYTSVVPGHEKSLVVTSAGCYASPISAFTLHKRLQSILSFRF